MRILLWRLLVAVVLVGFVWVLLPHTQVQAYACNKTPKLALTAPTSGTVGQAVPFTASVQPASGNCPVASWYLSFGDGELLSGQSATTLTTSHVYTLASEWTAELGAQGVTGPPSAPIQVRIVVENTPPPPPPPPAEWTFCGSEGDLCSFVGTKEVRYGVLSFDGGVWVYGTFTNSVNCNTDRFGGIDPATGQTKQCWYRDTTSPPPPPPSSARGPQPTITCPTTGVVNLLVGTNIPATVAVNAPGTTFCVKTGVHAITSEIIPKSGQTFIGEYGAVIDGSTWTTSNIDVAAFKGNSDIDDVTIKNLVIRNMPFSGIRAYPYEGAERWILANNDIVDNKRYGVQLTTDGLAINNRILRNTGVALSGGYTAFRSNRATFDNNEIAYNAHEGKIVHAPQTTFRNNWVHHNDYAGIWFDGDSQGSIVEDNIVEDNAVFGITFEVAIEITARRNIVRRNGWNGFALQMSKQIQVYDNTIEDNGSYGMTLQVQCGRAGGGEYTGWDLADNNIHDNVFRVPVGGHAAGYNQDGCSAAQEAPYLTNSKNNHFVDNAYHVPVLTNNYWLWGTGVNYNWSGWQALPQDAGGTVQVR
jgi:parallel beta-helix repeat protein